MIDDLGSRNGTFVNGERVTSPTAVKAGDTITMSASTIRVLGKGSHAPTKTQREIIGEGSIFRPASELVQASKDLPAPSEDPATESMRQYAERLSILNDVHQTLATSIQLDDLLDTILDRTFDHLGPQYGSIFLRGEDDQPHLAASRPRSADANEHVVSQSLIREVMDKGMAALVHDVRVDDRFAEAKSLLEAGVRSLVAAPLADPKGTLGMIVLSSSADVRVFSEDDLQLLSSLAAVAALRIRNIALAEEEAERRRLEEEVALAREIQVALIPDELPKVPGYEIYGGNSPSQGVSGDYYEVMERLDGRECVLFIADVSGKGIAASLLTIYIEALSTTPIEDGLAPDDVFTRVSRRMYHRTPHDRFATAFLAALDPSTGVVRYSSAGHNPALLLRGDGSVEQLRSNGIALGLLPVEEFASAEITLGVGDVLVLYTDGITEAINPDEELYGIERLEAACKRHIEQPLEELARSLEQDLEQFAAGVEFADDRTIVMARRLQ
jgi:serine phosphatase RsbU (regulator of sigma subunit)